MRIIKGISAFILAAVMMITLSSCGKAKDVVFTLNGTKIYSKDVDIFAYMYVMEHSLVDADKLEDIYENGETYSEHYINDLEEEIVLAVLLSKEADENKVVLSDEDKDKAKVNADKLFERFGEEKLIDSGIEKADVEEIYEMRFRGDAYAASIGNEYADVSDDRYIRVFQVTFPTVVLDDSGMVKSNKDGELIRISVGEMEQMKADAESFSEKGRSGEDIKALLKDEPESVTGVERTLKYEDLSEDYKKSVDKLSQGDVSEVINGDYGYYVIEMLNNDDKDHAASIDNYEKQVNAIAARDELYEKLLNSYVGKNQEYRNDKLWEEMSIRKYMQ